MLGLASNDCNLHRVFQPVERLGEVPGVGVPVTSRRQVFNFQSYQFTRVSPEVHGVNYDQLPCHFRIKQRENEMRASEACIHGFDIVGEIEAQKLLNHCRSEPVISEQRVATPCNHNLWIQHASSLTG